MRAEYSTGDDKPPLWMQVGAVTVKEYGWYKAMFWGGGRVSFTVDRPGHRPYRLPRTSATTSRTPPRTRSTSRRQTGPGGTSTPATFRRRRSIAPWPRRGTCRCASGTLPKNVSRLFLSGYRSGKNMPAAPTPPVSRSIQASLHDCINKKLTSRRRCASFRPCPGGARP